MKKKLYTILFAAASLLGYTSCDSLDLTPESSIADSGYWKDADHFNAFHTGISSYFRGRAWNYYVYGEARASILAVHHSVVKQPRGWKICITIHCR